jgi:hypothetical protein
VVEPTKWKLKEMRAHDAKICVKWELAHDVWPIYNDDELWIRSPQAKSPEAKAGIVFVKDVSMDKILHMDKCQ